jgi:hypothetical protein
MKARSVVGGGLVILALLSGCSSGSGGDAAPASKKVATTIDPSKATVLKFGDSLKVVAELPRKLGDQNVYLDSFSDDGKLLGSVSLPEKPSGSMGVLTRQAYPVMYDLDTKQFTILSHAARARKTQVAQTVGTNETVVWWETPDATVDVSNIGIYAYDRQSKKITKLATFSDPDGKTVFGNDLVIRGNTAYFSRPVYRNKMGKKPAVYSVPVDGSKPAKILVAGGQQVELVGDTLTYWMGSKRFSRDLATGKTTPVPVSSHAGDPGFCGAEFTSTLESWCVGTPTGNNQPPDFADAILTIKEKSGRTTTFRPFPTDSLNYPLPRDLVTLGRWTAITMTGDDGANSEFLVDLATGVVKVFPDGTSFGPVSRDGTLALLGTFADKGPGVQRVVQIPTD